MFKKLENEDRNIWLRIVTLLTTRIRRTPVSEGTQGKGVLSGSLLPLKGFNNETDRGMYIDNVRLCNPMDCSPPGPSVHGIFPAGILEWVAISFSRRSFWPRDWTQVSCIIGRFFTIWATREAHCWQYGLTYLIFTTPQIFLNTKLVFCNWLHLTQ